MLSRPLAERPVRPRMAPAFRGPRMPSRPRAGRSHATVRRLHRHRRHEEDPTRDRHGDTADSDTPTTPNGNSPDPPLTAAIVNRRRRTTARVLSCGTGRRVSGPRMTASISHLPGARRGPGQGSRRGEGPAIAGATSNSPCPTRRSQRRHHRSSTTTRSSKRSTSSMAASRAGVDVVPGALVIGGRESRSWGAAWPTRCSPVMDSGTC